MKDIEDFLNVEQIFKIGALPLVTILLIISIVILIWKRTKSTHSIMSRLWIIFNGKNKTDDIEINKILDTRSALMQFRFTTGIPIRLRTQIEPLIFWGHKNEEDLDDIARCGYLFDLEKPGLRDIKESNKIRWSIILLVFLSITVYATMFSILMATTNKALLKIIASENWVLLGDDTAKRISLFNFDSYATLDKENCSAGKLEKYTMTKLQKEDVILLCDSIINKTGSKIIKSSVELQRFVFIPVSLFLFSIAIMLYGFLLNIANSKSMAERLKKRMIQSNSPDYSI